jgi:hypothetical protein
MSLNFDEIMKKFYDDPMLGLQQEDAPANSVAGGGVALPPDAVMDKKKKKEKDKGKDKKEKRSASRSRSRSKTKKDKKKKDKKKKDKNEKDKKIKAGIFSAWTQKIL